MKIVKIYLPILLFMISTAAFSDTYQVALTFVNCTNQKIELNNEANPYKFSLIPSKSADNGYSDPYHLTIPASSVFEYSGLSVYFNNYIDGSMELHFSGGVTGYATIHQAHDVRTQSCCAYKGCCGTTHSIDMISTSSDSPRIVFLTPTQILDQQLANTNHLVISLGCNEHKNDH